MTPQTQAVNTLVDVPGGIWLSPDTEHIDRRRYQQHFDIPTE